MPRPEWSFFMLPEDHQEVKWSQSYIQAKFTEQGQIALGVLLMGLFVSSVGTETSAFLFVTFVGALLLSSLALSLFFKPTISATLSLPPTPTAGGICFCQIALTNTGQRSLRNIDVFFHRLPYGLYAETHHPRHRSSVDWLAPKECVVLNLALRIPRRGSFTIQPLLVGSSFPTGILRSLVRVTPQMAFVVYPKRFDVNNPPFVSSDAFHAGSSDLLARSGRAEEFLSTREYRDGDQWRDIHWNSTAKAGKFIVKEYADQRFVHAGILLDNQLLRFEKHRSFESLVSLCAGLAQTLQGMNYHIDLFLCGTHATVVRLPGQRERLDTLFTTLSALEGEERFLAADTLKNIQREAAGLSQLIVLLRDWDIPRSRIVASLRELRIPLSIMIIRDQPLTMPTDDPTIKVYASEQLLTLP